MNDMEAKELMIGDWAINPIHNDCVQIEGVYFDKELCSLVASDGRFPQIYFEPIPLTKEILKANGFEYIEAFGQWWQMHNDRTSSLQLITDDIDDVDTLGVTVCDCGSMKLKYVHTLQHALRLCGLNELADNFKIV